MKTNIKRLLIDNALIISNAAKLETGKKTIKDKKALAELIAKRNNGDKDNIYMQLYRAEKDGYITENKTLVDQITKELNVTRKVLISETFN